METDSTLVSGNFENQPADIFYLQNRIADEAIAVDNEALENNENDVALYAIH